MNPGNDRARSSGAGFALWMLLVCAATAHLLGCSKETQPRPGDAPPVTYLSIQGTSLDTLSYHIVLHWWGTDPDGQVVGYLIRWNGAWNRPSNSRPWGADSTWAFTTAETDTFDVPIAATYGERTFTVRAVDNAGQVDTPGKSQTFRVRDSAPTIAWSATLTLPDTTLPVTPFAIHVYDADGVDTVRHIRYWLTPDPALHLAAPDTVDGSDTLLVLKKSDFGADSTNLSGRWTVHFQAMDAAGLRSGILSHQWSVIMPTGDYLLIDEAPHTVPGYAVEDTTYRALMDSLHAAYTTQDLEVRGHFQTPEVVYPFFKMFRGVVWYSAIHDVTNDAAVVQDIGVAESGIREYVQSGGRFLFIATNAVGTGAAFSDPFSSQVLGVQSVFQDALIGSDIGVMNRSILQVDLGQGPDSVKTSNSSPDADFVALNAGPSALIFVPPGYLAQTYPQLQISPDQSQQPAVLGLMNSYGSGRIGLVTFMLSRVRGFSFAQGRRIQTALFRHVLLD